MDVQKELADVVSGLLREADEWAKRCKGIRDSLDQQGQMEFDELYRVLTVEPLTEEAIELYIMLEDWDTLEKNKELLALRDKWKHVLTEEQLPEPERS